MHAHTSTLKMNPAALHTHDGGEVTESLDSTVVLVDLHTLSFKYSWYCVRGVGQLLEVFLMSM